MLFRSSQPTRLPLDLSGEHIVLVDDVLHTGRTMRAALNELFEYGRPASVKLAVLADRGGRELPFAAQFCGGTVHVPAQHELVLLNTSTGLTLSMEAVTL